MGLTMTSRRIVAVFETRDAAQRARDALLGLGLQTDHISIVDQTSGQRSVNTAAARGSFWAHVKEMFMPAEDRDTLEESVRRGGFVVIATVDDSRADEAIAQLESSGAVDLNEKEENWRASGWKAGAGRSESDVTGGSATLTGSTPTPATRMSAASATASPSAIGRTASSSTSASTPGLESVRTASPASASLGGATEERIPVVEERLLVGKRELNRGSVRVRSYIVEEPVHQEVTLHEERVAVERRPVDAPVRSVVGGSDEDLFQERSIEVSESAEQAVVGKEARVTEEVVVSKTAGERVESVDDTVRHTRVDVEDGRTSQEDAYGTRTSDRPVRGAPVTPPETRGTGRG